MYKHETKLAFCDCKIVWFCSRSENGEIYVEIIPYHGYAYKDTGLHLTQ